MSFFQFSPIVHVTLGFAVVGVVTAVGFYIMGRIRASSLQKEPPPVEILQKFREMNSGGVLSDDEFRIIKRQLSAKAVHGNFHQESRPVFIEDRTPLPGETPTTDTLQWDISKEETEKFS